VHGNAARVLGQGFLEDLLGLRIAAVGDVDVGFGDRIDLLGFHARRGLAHRGLRHDLPRGRARLACRARDRTGCGGAKHAVLEFRVRGLLAPP
jgi:hypothetical protein